MQKVEENDSCVNFHKNNVIDLELSHIPEATPTSKTPQAPECRICLQSERTEDNELVTPCNCTGSVQYIHVACFKTWVRKKAEDPKVREQILGEEGIKCEICKEKYQYSFTINRYCASSNYFCNRLKTFRFFGIASIIFILLDLSLLGAVTWFAITDKNHRDYNMKDPRYFLIYIAMLFCLAGLIFGVYEFVKTFLAQSRFSITPENKPKGIKDVCRDSSEIKNLTDTGEFRKNQSIFKIVRGNRVENSL